MRIVKKGNDMLGLLDELISLFTDTAKDILGAEEGSITDKAIDIGAELDKILLNDLVDCYDFQKDVLKNSLKSLHDQCGDPFIVSAYMHSIIENGKRVIKIYFDFENWVEAVINTGLKLKV